MAASDTSHYPAEYKLLEECILSGQVGNDKVEEILRADPEFARWANERATDRQNQSCAGQHFAASNAPEIASGDEVSLVSLAAWLHRQAVQAETLAAGACGEPSARAHRDSAARFARASEVVKKAADNERVDRVAAKSRPAANKA